MPRKTISLALGALTLAAFAIGTSEFVIMGLLVDIANDFNISAASAGLLVSAYALGVVFGGPLIAVLTSKWPRKPLLIGLVAVFALGNICCALAEDFRLLIAARILTAMCHGTYFGVATVAAVELVPKDYRAQAVAWVFMGTTLANMLGVPLGTAEGFHFGWRSTFWTVAGIGALAIIALIIWVPRGLPDDRGDPWKEFVVLKQPKVVIPLALSALLNGALFIVYTYIAPLLMQVTNLGEHGVTTVLLILGLGLPLGTFIGGRLGDYNLLGSLKILFPLIAVFLLLLHFTAQNEISGVAVMFCWTMLTFTVAPMLQLLVVDNAGNAPNLASTFNQSAFNVGNAAGAWGGSLLLKAHYHLTELPLFAIGILGTAWILVFIYGRISTQRS